MALPLYALTLFVSAFILFLVQPIIGKILLPKLGGTPQVWNTCMVFFQTVLLAGYAYTHNVSTRLNLRQQIIVHSVLLFLPLIILLPIPFALSLLGPDHSIRAFVPDLGSNPVGSTLKVLFTYVALPFVVVATTAPLLQKWFGATGHPAAKDPYFLYGASNFGSMLSLMLYPFVIEPYFSLGAQTYLYAWGFIALLILVLTCAALVWNSREATQPVVRHEVKPELPPAPTPTTTSEPQTAIASGAPAVGGAKQASRLPSTRPQEASVALPSDEVTAGRRFRWVMLAAVPSSLMLGITTHITTDLSPIPVFWLVPLILYLGSFILVFMRWPFLWTERKYEPATHGGPMKPHQYMLYAQPFCLFFMIMVDIWNLTSSPAMISVAILAHGLGFFATTMVCHGELAKDRPTTKHLTEFYLWMSVGGMVGGMFNGLIAPVIFNKLWELPLAIFAAALVRPKMFEVGWFDNLFASVLESPGDAPMPQKAKGPRPVQTQVASDSLVSKLDWAWPLAILVLCGALVLLMGQRIAMARTERDVVSLTLIAFGIPLALACLGMTRPLRIGLGVGAVLLMYHFNQNRADDGTVHSSRSYFGTISVKEHDRRGPDGKGTIKYRQLVHGHINHGLNYVVPTSVKDRGDPEKDLSRLATTYYHREGPVGRVMEKYNWFFRGGPNTYHADARMPASLIASLAADVVSSSFPMVEMVTLWSEPPIATVGLGTGTMASYGRPYQHVHFYEIDNQIRRLSLVMASNEIKTFDQYNKVKADTAEFLQPKFNYLERAIERGSTVQVLMSDARLRMALEYKNHYLDETDRGGGPNNFYHMMVVDAFSSDAIPAHLLTEEAFKMYFEKLVPEGVLCVHTSNRFVDLPKVVGAVASKLTWSDYELRLDSVSGDHKDEIARVIQDSTGVSLEDARKLVDSTGSIQSGLSLKEATALERRLTDLGAKVTRKEHSHAYKAKRGHDVNDDRETKNLGHYTSEWVMVARKNEYMLNPNAEDEFNANYAAEMKRRHPDRRVEPYWDLPSTDKKYVWTDDYYNLMSVVRFR